MAQSRGRDAVARYIRDIPRTVEEKVLVGAARAAGRVIADEAEDQSVSQEVSDNITVRTKASDGRITARIGVKPGWARSIGIWLEYGTTPHFISVDPSQLQGRSAARINRLEKTAKAEGGTGPAASLVINGKFVGETIYHPGARRMPFLRTALDSKEAEAIAAAQAYINSHLKAPGLAAEPEDE
jgi:hypothetical protein